MELLPSLAVTALTLITACGEAEPKRAPNVVVVVIDTLRADELPPYGGADSNAPFISELAAEGVVFENAWSTSSWTAPATASIFTSQHPNEHGVTLGLQLLRGAEKRGYEFEFNRIPDALETLPEFMKSVGYSTFAVTDNINIDEPIGFHSGFDRFHYLQGFAESGARRLNEKVMSWKDEILSGDPFFLYLHFMDPHEPYVRHGEWMEEDEPETEDRLMDIAAYRSEIRNVDENLRQIFAELGLGDDTIVLLTADHGQEFMDHGRTGHKWTLFSELTHVPLVMRIGKDGPRGRSASNVSNLDIMPTLRELLGAPPSHQDRGVSLLGAVSDTERGDREIFAMRTDLRDNETREIRSIVRGKHKLIVNEVTGFVKLFDLEADPGESQNLAPREKKLCTELLALIEEQKELASLVQILESGTRRLNPAEIERLKTLGYTGD